MNANEPHPLVLDDPRFALVDGRTRPEFMLVGGMKCGSTSFARHDFQPGGIFLAENRVAQSRYVDSAKFAQWYVDIHIYGRCEIVSELYGGRISCTSHECK